MNAWTIGDYASSIVNLLELIQIEQFQAAFSVGRSQGYELRNRLVNLLCTVSESREVIFVNNQTVDKVILSLAMNCFASTEGIARALEQIGFPGYSESYIAERLCHYSSIAKEFNESTDLSKIHAAASDEIFSSGKPIFAVIDLGSTFVARLEMQEDRSADTWELIMAIMKESQNLNLQLSISDAGSGLLKGIKDAFPDCAIQVDIFHTLIDLGKEIYAVEDRALSRLSKLADVQARLASGARLARKTIERLPGQNRQVDAALAHADRLKLLYNWFKETLGFTGYTKDETIKLLLWILEQIEQELTEDDWRVKRRVDQSRTRILKLVGFHDQLHSNIRTLAEEAGIPVEAVEAQYSLRACCLRTEKAIALENVLAAYPRRVRDEAYSLMLKAIAMTPRASSLVENVNSRIRMYLNAKKGMVKSTLPLLQLYLNTKKYRRSEVAERVGKSPIELLTGKHVDFFEVLGL